MDPKRFSDTSPFLGAEGKKEGREMKGESNHGLEGDGIFDDLCRDDVSVGRGGRYLGGLHGLRAFRAARLDTVAGFGSGNRTKGAEWNDTKRMREKNEMK